MGSRATPERVARFKREAQLLAALNHPHIASIYGLEEVIGGHFLVLELVEGDTLAQRIASGPVPVTEALRLARQVADALQAAPEKGIIHRVVVGAVVASGAWWSVNRPRPRGPSHDSRSRLLRANN